MPAILICLGPEHRLISPDFPGHAVAVLEEAGHQSLYLNGCSGDIGPHQAFQGPQAARNEGGKLAEAVLNACRQARPEESPLLRADSARFQLPYDDLPAFATIEADLVKADRTVRPQERENQRIQTAFASGLASSGWLNSNKLATADERYRRLTSEYR